jgi:neutral ceramidase
VSLEPPLGLPMVGFVRRYDHARGYGSPLEANAVVLSSDSGRIALVGIDTLGIQRPQADELRERVAEAIGGDITGVVLNWSHTHSAPPATRALGSLGLGGIASEATARAVASYCDVLCERIVDVARRAAKAAEPAALVWGVGSTNVGVNRRERRPDGRVIIGWRPDGLLDNTVTTLQARRSDGSTIATVVSYGCHPIALSADVLEYSADYPGPMRQVIRDWTGGQVVFLQGAGGNVVPHMSFGGHLTAADMGRSLALAALHSVGERLAGAPRWTRGSDGSATPYAVYRLEHELGDAPRLAAVSADVTFPLMPLPTLEEITATRSELETTYREARASGEPQGKLNVHLYHLTWAQHAEAAVRGGTAAASTTGPISAIRIGDGAIVTGPGEIFTEIGMAVKERSPAVPTMYAGYTNGAVSYFPTADAYAEGGYEPEFGNQTYGLPAPVSPECERILIERSVGLLHDLFPDRMAPVVDGWTATGSLPTLPPQATLPSPPWT